MEMEKYEGYKSKRHRPRCLLWYCRSGHHLPPALREYSFRCWEALYLIRSVAPSFFKVIKFDAQVNGFWSPGE